MNSKLLNLLTASAALVSTGVAAPSGFLNADALVVRETGVPSLSWEVNLPNESLRDVITLDNDNKTMEAKTDLQMTVKVLGVAFGPSSDPFLINASYKKTKNGKGKFKQFFEGRAPDVDPLDNLVTRKVKRGETVSFAFHGAQNSGPDTPTSEFDWQPELFPSAEDTRMLLLRNGDVVPSTIPAFDQADIVSFLLPYLRADGKTLLLGERDVIVLTELSDKALGDPTADFQDCVVLVTFNDKKDDDDDDDDDD